MEEIWNHSISEVLNSAQKTREFLDYTYVKDGNNENYYVDNRIRHDTNSKASKDDWENLINSKIYQSNFILPSDEIVEQGG